MDLFLWWRDWSLAFHELCALYAGTCTFALFASMMPSLRFIHSSRGACRVSLRCLVCRNYITLQLKFKKQLIYNYYVTIPWVL